MLKTCWRESFPAKEDQGAHISKPVIRITVLAGWRA
jgi:hypothetical protein